MADIEAVRTLDVVLTTRCNLSCSYCYENCKPPYRRMDWATLRAAIDLLLRSAKSAVKLGFYGGEPLLCFDAIRRAVEYAEQARPPDKQLRYGIVTNGTLMQGATIKFLAAHHFRTQLSFDGVPEAQCQRGAQTFAVLDTLLDRLRREHPLYFEEDLYVVSTLLPSTVSHLADSIDYFLGKGLREIHVSPQLTDTSGWRIDQIDELDLQFERIHDACVRQYLDTGRVPFSAFSKHEETEGRPREIGMCGVGRGRTLTVDVDGEVHGCVSFAGSYQNLPSDFLASRFESMRMGNLDAREFSRKRAEFPDAARAARIFDAKQDKYSSYGRCGECRYLGECDVCPVSIGHIPGNTDPDRVPDFICAFNLVLNKYRERFPRQPKPIDFLTGQVSVPRRMQELQDFVRLIENRRFDARSEGT